MLAGAETTHSIGTLGDEYFKQLTDPFIVVENAMKTLVTRGLVEAVTELETSMLSMGLTRKQGHIMLAFKTMLIDIAVLDHESFGWDEARTQLVKEVMQDLIELQCPELSLLYIVAPFIELGTTESIQRLRILLKTIGGIPSTLKEILQRCVSPHGLAPFVEDFTSLI